jgi:hypothetical protein
MHPPPTIRLMRPEETDATARMWQGSQRAAYTWFRDDQWHPLDEAIGFFRDSICVRCEVFVAVGVGVDVEGGELVFRKEPAPVAEAAS